jgi:hypothetical protein
MRLTDRLDEVLVKMRPHEGVDHHARDIGDVQGRLGQLADNDRAGRLRTGDLGGIDQGL